MKRSHFIALFVLLLFAGAPPCYLQVRPSPTPKVLSARQVVDKVMPSVVLVVTQDNRGETISQGSGFVYKPGLVVTNLHVLKRASRAYIRSVGKEINYKVAKVVAIDARHDLCILQVDEKVLPPVVINAKSNPAIGDEVFAFGNPKGLEGTVSKGIISSIRSDLELLQIDAAISPGSSGGPVVDDRGELIGISVSSLSSGQNLNFAIPSLFLTRMSDQQFPDELLNKLNEILGGGKASKNTLYGVSISEAGAVAVNDREAILFRGPVKSMTTLYAGFDYDEKRDKYSEEARKPSSKATYDLFGNMIEDWKYHNGELAWKYLYSYDENGLRTTVIWEPAPGTEEKREVFQYSPAEAVRRRLDVDGVNLAGTFEDSAGKRVYDLLGNRVESVIKVPITLPRTRWLNSFDSNGLVREEKLYEADKLTKVYRYEYEFDSRGNWIRQSRTEFNSKYPSLGFLPLSVTYREITYF